MVRRWAEKWAKSKPAATTEDPLEDLEGTVVTEADSAPCTSEGEEGEGRGEGDEGVTKAEGEVEGVGDIAGTCEAEAREISASESQGGCDRVLAPTATQTSIIAPIDSLVCSCYSLSCFLLPSSRRA